MSVYTNGEEGTIEPTQVRRNIRVSSQKLTDSIESSVAEIALEPPDSGDFHEVFVVPDNSGDVAVLLGDVTGHGAPAAAKAQTIRSEVISHLKAGDTPLEAVQAANQVSQSSDDRFSTLFVAKISDRSGTVTYANAGHEPPHITEPNGSITELKTTGPPLGVVPPGIDAFEQEGTYIPPGGTLVVNTDGVTEARKPDESKPTFFGHERLKPILVRLRKSPPARTIMAVVHNVLRFTRSVLSDDIVVMAVRRRQRNKLIE